MSLFRYLSPSFVRSFFSVMQFVFLALSVLGSSFFLYLPISLSRYVLPSVPLLSLDISFLLESFLHPHPASTK